MQYDGRSDVLHMAYLKGYTIFMLQLSSTFLNRSILSLRTGGVVATVISPIINPDNLKIEGFYCSDIFNKNILILLCQDIRELATKGFYVNDHEVLAEPEELVRPKTILDIRFELIGKPVITVSKEKVGKVSDYATDLSSMFIQKLYVSQSVFKSFTGGNLSIDRTQIHEITPKNIVINELLKKAKLPSPVTAPTAL